jgi:hypothetical protein
LMQDAVPVSVIAKRSPSSPVSSVILGSSTKKKLEMPVNAG